MGSMIRLFTLAALFALAACSHLTPGTRPSASKDARTQLAIGYTLLYQEADGIPKLNWLLMFKEKSSPMAELTSEIVTYYRGLADRMQTLSKQYPAVRIDVTAMSEIESEERKALGKDQAKDFAPLIGKSGT